jgi:hypothetical protein
MKAAASRFGVLVVNGLEKRQRAHTGISGLFWELACKELCKGSGVDSTFNVSVTFHLWFV